MCHPARIATRMTAASCRSLRGGRLHGASPGLTRHSAARSRASLQGSALIMFRRGGREGLAAARAPRSCRGRGPRSGVQTTAVLNSDTCFLAATLFVMPFYSLMLFAPKQEYTKKLISSPMPYLVLSVLYLYLLVKAWSPDSARLIMNPDFYFLPQLEGIATLFARTTVVASAWVHLLCVDLFAAIQVYLDALKEDVPMKHSLVLCMMCCPVGILAHFFTKSFVVSRRPVADATQESEGVGAGAATA